MSTFPGKKRYEGVRFNIISVTRRWVGVQFPGKKRYITLEWPLNKKTSKSSTYNEGNGERFNVLWSESMVGHIKDRVIQVTEEIGRGDDSQLSTRVVVNPGS